MTGGHNYTPNHWFRFVSVDFYDWFLWFYFYEMITCMMHVQRSEVRVKLTAVVHVGVCVPQVVCAWWLRCELWTEVGVFLWYCAAFEPVGVNGGCRMLWCVWVYCHIVVLLLLWFCLLMSGCRLPLCTYPHRSCQLINTPTSGLGSNWVHLYLSYLYLIQLLYCVTARVMLALQIHVIRLLNMMHCHRLNTW